MNILKYPRGLKVFAKLSTRHKQHHPNIKFGMLHIFKKRAFVNNIKTILPWGFSVAEFVL